jgi:DUF2934 family protein
MAKTEETSPRAVRKTRAARPPVRIEQIQLRAYEIFLERRGAPGNPMEDWLRAERELSLNGSPKPGKRRSPKSKAA